MQIHPDQIERPRPPSFQQDLDALEGLSEARKREYIDSVLYDFASDFMPPLKRRKVSFDCVILDLPSRSSSQPIGMDFSLAGRYGGKAIEPLVRWWSETAAFREFVARHGREEDKIRMAEIETMARMAERQARSIQGTPISLWNHVKWFLLEK